MLFFSRGVKIRNLSGEVIYQSKSQSLAYQDLSNLDLRGADLRDEDLSGTQFVGTQLYEACLDGTIATCANFTRAALANVTLRQAELSGATLSETNLFQTHFIGTELFGASLRGADCTRTNFHQSNLCRADLSGANLSDIYGDQICMLNAKFGRAQIDWDHNELIGWILLNHAGESYARRAAAGACFLSDEWDLTHFLKKINDPDVRSWAVKTLKPFVARSKMTPPDYLLHEIGRLESGQ